MKTQMNEKVEHLFDETFQLTGITEYGIGWDDFMNGQTEIPLPGARFDLYFEGEVFGEEVNGKLKGVDFLEVRPDGRFLLNIQVTIITDDGETISMSEDGILIPNHDGSPSDLFLNMKFSTHSEKYGWLNSLHVWGTGQVDNSTGQGKVSAFSSKRITVYS